MTRPSIETSFLDMAALVAKRSTCLRRNVGCVLVNPLGHIISTGYNGVAAGQPHCNEKGIVSEVSSNLDNRYTYACEGAYASSGKDLDKCKAIHAEQNALLQCSDVYNIDIAYITVSPCITCVKLFLNTSCQFIIFKDKYSHSEAKDLWTASGRDWIHYKGENK